MGYHALANFFLLVRPCRWRPLESCHQQYGIDVAAVSDLHTIYITIETSHFLQGKILASEEDPKRQILKRNPPLTVMRSEAEFCDIPAVFMKFETIET